MVRHFLVCSVLVGGAVVAMVRGQDSSSGLGAPAPVSVDASAPAGRTAGRPYRGSNRYSSRGSRDAAAATRRTAAPREFAPPADATAADDILPNLPSVLKRRGSGSPARPMPPAVPVNTPVASSIGDDEPAELEMAADESSQTPGSYGSDGAAVDDSAVEDAANAYGGDDGEAEEWTEEPAEAVEAAPYDESGEARLGSPAPTVSPNTTTYMPGAPAELNTAAPRSGGAALQVSSRAPSVRVDVSGPGALIVGKPSVYRVWMVNEGAEPARNLEVHVALPARVELANHKSTSGDVQRAEHGVVTWTVGQLAGGGDEELSLVVVPTDAQPFDVSVEWSAQPMAATARIEVQQPQLQVDISGPAEILFGARQIYTITIANPGTGPAENVLLDVTTGGGSQSKRLGIIPAGGREQIRMELIAREAGQLDIRAVAAGDGALRSEANQKILVRRAELAVELVAPPLKFAGSTGTYEVHVTNTGNAPATDIEVSLRKPGSVKYAGGVEGAQETGGRIAWTIPHLDVQEQLMFTVELAYEQAGSVMCEAVAAAGELAAADSAETRVEAIADLKLVVNDPENPKLVGDDVVYEIRVINQGTKPSGPVNVLGQFSEGIEPVRAEGAGADVVPGQVIFQQIQSVAPGQTIALKIVARADKSGNHRFRAVLKATEPETELIAEDMTRFFGSELGTSAGPARVTRKPQAKR